MVSSVDPRTSAMIIVSALQGGTIVHITIVFLFFVIRRRSATRRGFTSPIAPPWHGSARR